MYAKTTREVAEYVMTTYTHGSEVATAIETLDVPTIPKPAPLAETADDTDKAIWNEEIKEHVKHKKGVVTGMKKAHALIWGQCTEAMRAKLEAKDNHATIASSRDVVGLLKNIRAIMFHFQSQKKAEHSLHEAKRRFYMLTQGKDMSCQQYRETFTNLVEVIEHCGGAVGDEPGMVDKVLGELKPPVARIAASDEEMEDARAAAKERYLACAFLLGSDRNRYGRLIEDLENSFTQKQDLYPTTLNDAYDLLLHWKQDPRNVMQVIEAADDGLAFATVGEEPDKKGTKKDKPKDKSHITCFDCGEKGTTPTNAPANSWQIPMNKRMQLSSCYRASKTTSSMSKSHSSS